MKGQVANLEALVGALLCGDDRSIADQWIVDTRVRHQVGLELVQIHVKGTIEAQTGGDGANDLGNEAVKVLVIGARNVQAAAANVVDRFIVDKEGTIRVLDGAVSREHGVVRLNDRGRDTRGRVDGKLELALLAVVGGETLEEEGAESRSSSATERVEDKEALERGAVIWGS